MAQHAVDAVIQACFYHEWSQKKIPLNRRMCHIVVLVPAMKKVSRDYPNHLIKPHVLLEHSFGPRSEWPWKFDEIARSKALQLWHDRLDVMPHLLSPGDTPFWGGVKRHGIVVACSGVQPWFDKMISGMVADTCVALAQDCWENSQDKKDDVCFLT
ncbi:MAG: hypothetical protein WAW81_01880 [Minisyncoccia bacterium]